MSAEQLSREDLAPLFGAKVAGRLFVLQDIIVDMNDDEFARFLELRSHFCVRSRAGNKRPRTARSRDPTPPRLRHNGFSEPRLPKRQRSRQTQTSAHAP